MNDRLGPLPGSYFATWSRSSLYFTHEKVQYNSFTGPFPEGEDPLSAQSPSLETAFDRFKPTDISDSEAAKITLLIRRILQYDPTERPTASQILQDEWFTADDRIEPSQGPSLQRV
jgi:serine/threonine protein kinase